MLIRFRIPSDCAGVVLDGVPLVIGSDRSIEADESMASTLMAHGIVPWTSAPKQPASAPPTPPLAASTARDGNIDPTSRADRVAMSRGAGLVGRLAPNIADTRKVPRSALGDPPKP